MLNVWGDAGAEKKKWPKLGGFTDTELNIHLVVAESHPQHVLWVWHRSIITWLLNLKHPTHEDVIVFTSLQHQHSNFQLWFVLVGDLSAALIVRFHFDSGDQHISSPLSASRFNHKDKNRCRLTVGTDGCHQIWTWTGSRIRDAASLLNPLSRALQQGCWRRCNWVCVQGSCYPFRTVSCINT